MAFRRSLLRRAHNDPELSKYAHATFFDGSHREAPHVNHKAHMDRKSPVLRVLGWLATPVAKGTMLAAWCVTGVASYYSACVADDAKSTYLVNTALQRHLHLETMKAQASALRLENLQAEFDRLSFATVAGTSAAGKGSKVAAAPAAAQDKNGQSVPATDIREEIATTDVELNRERRRANENHARNELLVSELHNTRYELREAVKERDSLREEVIKLNKYIKQVTAE